MGEAERGDIAPRVRVTFWCANGHQTTPSFSTEAGIAVPTVWDCPRCGFPAGPDQDNPPSPARVEPYKTQLAYVKAGRTWAMAQRRPYRGTTRFHGYPSAHWPARPNR